MLIWLASLVVVGKVYMEKNAESKTKHYSPISTTGWPLVLYSNVKTIVNSFKKNMPREEYEIWHR